MWEELRIYVVCYGEDSYLNSFLKHLDCFYLISGFWVAINAVLDEIAV